MLFINKKSLSFGQAFYFPLKPFQFAVEALDGETHNVVERALEALDADVADPLLNAVAARLIHRSEALYVVTDLLLGERAEIDVALHRKALGACARTQRYARRYAVRSTR